jgi:hypothetical protein
MLATPDVHELFEWLRGLSFIESGRLGLYPHDLAREALVADLRWRHPIGSPNCIRTLGAITAIDWDRPEVRSNSASWPITFTSIEITR